MELQEVLDQSKAVPRPGIADGWAQGMRKERRSEGRTALEGRSSRKRKRKELEVEEQEKYKSPLGIGQEMLQQQKVASQEDP